MLRSRNRIGMTPEWGGGYFLSFVNNLLIPFPALDPVCHGRRRHLLQLSVGPGFLSWLRLGPASARNSGYSHLYSLWLLRQRARLRREGCEDLSCVPQAGDGHAYVGGGRTWIPGACGWQALLSMWSRGNGIPHQTNALSRWRADCLLHLYQLQVGNFTLLLHFLSPFAN